MNRRRAAGAKRGGRQLILGGMALLLAGGLAGSLPGLAGERPAAGAAARIETIAGGGPVGDGGKATAARLSLPGGLAIAPDGALVIVDFGHHRIRRVDPVSGVISTIVGTGEAGFNGDGIPAHRAQISRPEYAAFGPQGDLFVVDEYNHRIRRVDGKTGVITTVAGHGAKGFGGDGGPALGAVFHQPEGIAADAAGNLYIGDTLNSRVRRIDGKTGIVTTVAGSGEIGTSPAGTLATEAAFLRIARLAADPGGNLYIADSPAQRIFRLDAATGRLAIAAGNGELGYSGDGGPATAARISFPEGPALDAAGNLYFCDLGNHRVRRVDARTGIITTVAGTGEKGFSGDGGPAAAARLWSPGRLTVDRAGNLFIGDTGNSRVRRVDARTGVIRTVAGNGDLGDGGPATRANLTIPGDLVYAGGKVFVADFGNRRIRRIDLASGLITTVAGGGAREPAEGMAATEAELLLPEGIAVDPRGANLYIADNISSRVFRVDLATGILHAFAGTGEAGFSGDGGPAGQARLRLPSAVAAAADGNVYIADFGNRKIRVVDHRGTIRTLDKAADDRGLLGTAVVSLEATARGLFRLVLGNPGVELLDLHTGSVSQIPVDAARFPSQFSESQIMDVAADGSRLFLADSLAHRILAVDLETGETESVAGSGVQGFDHGGGVASRAALFQPGGVAVGRPGEIFVADTKNHLVRRVLLPPSRSAR